MADLAIITPTRGRPGRFADLVVTVARNSSTDVQIWAGLDDDDQTDYHAAMNGAAQQVGQANPNLILNLECGPRRCLSAWTNDLARMALDSPDPPRYLASLGDDHRPRTPSWDQRLIDAIEALGGSGFAYGNDLLQGPAMPTAWVASADIVDALGWMMLPGCAHMYVDNAIAELGRATGRIAYRADVIVEHLHPLAGKTAWDESYRQTNHADQYARDRAAFEQWLAEGAEADANTIRELVGAVT